MEFSFARHFSLLVLFGAILLISGPLGGLGIGARFALIGALHAAALALSIGGAAKRSPFRWLVFVAFAATLAMATARLGLLGLEALGALGGAPALCAVLAASAGLGALAYGALINAFLGTARGAPIPSSGARPAAPFGLLPRAPFGLLALGVTALGCAAATSLSFAVSRELHAASVLCLAIPWWFALSGGLWYAGHRRAV
jgi:hypothetical protein